MPVVALNCFCRESGLAGNAYRVPGAGFRPLHQGGGTTIMTVRGNFEVGVIASMSRIARSGKN